MEIYGNIRLVGTSKVTQPTDPIEDREVVTRKYYYEHLPNNSFYTVISEVTNILSKTIVLETVGMIRAISNDGYEVICEKTYSIDGLTVTLTFGELFTGQIIFIDNGSILDTVTGVTSNITLDLPKLGIVDVLDQSSEEIICSKNYIYDGLSGYSVNLQFNPPISGFTVIFNGNDSFIVDIDNESTKTVQVPGTGIVVVLDSGGTEVLVNKAYSFDGDSPIIRLEFGTPFTGKAIFVSTDNSFDLINILYDDFINILNNSKLRPGTQYKITDYRTINSISDIDADCEPLIVFALTNNRISNNVYSQLNKDIIDYDYSMNITDDLTNRPGYIKNRMSIGSYISTNGNSGITGSLIPSITGLSLGSIEYPWIVYTEQTLIDINNTTGITFSLPKRYGIIEVIDIDGNVVDCDKQYLLSGTTMNLVFSIPFTGKIIL